MTPSPTRLFVAFGPDRPDAVAVLVNEARELAPFRFEHRVIHGQVFLQIALPPESDGAVEALTAAATQLGLEARIQSVTAPDPGPTSSWRLTLFGSPLTAAVIARVGQNAVDRGFRVNSAHPAPHRRASADVLYLELAATEAVDEAALQADLRQIGSDPGAEGFDAVLCPNEVRPPRLLVMDVDSTLIRQEVIDELAREAGAYEKVAAITARAMNGELNFEESLRARVATLKGVPASTLDQVRERLELTDGAESLIRSVQGWGGRVAVISGGFIQVIDPLRRQLGVDFAFANTLEVRDGVLTGGLVGPIVDGARKADLLETLALSIGAPRSHVLAIGDGANDLTMLSRAGTGIAFHAKPHVRARAPHSLDQPRLDAVLYVLGPTFSPGAAAG